MHDVATPCKKFISEEMPGLNRFESSTYCALHIVRIGMGYIKLVSVIA